MQQSTNREKILKKIRSALLHKTSNPYPNLDFEKNVFVATCPIPEITFSENFTKVGGQFLLCENKGELIEAINALTKKNNWKDIFCVNKNISEALDEIHFPHQSIFDFAEDKFVEAAIITCEALIARTGTIVLSASQTEGKILPAIAKNLIVVANPNQFVDDIRSIISQQKATGNGQLSSSLFFLTGKGFYELHHGEKINSSLSPQKVYVILVSEQENKNSSENISG